MSMPQESPAEALNRLAEQAETGDQEEMSALIKQIKKMQKDTGVAPVVFAASVVEGWTDWTEVKKTLRALAYDKGSQEAMVCKALINSLDKKLFEQDEREFMMTLRREQTEKKEKKEAESIAAKGPAKREAPATSSSFEEGRARTTPSPPPAEAQPEPEAVSAPCGADMSMARESPAEALNRLAEQAETGGQEEMSALIKQIKKMQKDTGVAPVVFAASVVEGWTDWTEVKKTLRALSYNKGSQEAMVCKALINALDKKLFEQEEREFVMTLRREQIEKKERKEAEAIAAKGSSTRARWRS